MLKYRGFTFIELLVSLAILAILLVFSIPFSSSVYKNNNIHVVRDEIMSAVRFAKTYALANNMNVTLTSLSDDEDFSHGMILFVDNKTHHYTEDTQLLYKWTWKYPNVKVSWHGFKSNRYILFAANSSLNAVSGSFLIENSSKEVLKLVLNRLGRMR